MPVEINLLPPEYRKKEGMKLALPSDLPAGKMVLAALAGIFALQVAVSVYAFVQSARFSQVVSEIERLKVETKDIAAQKEEIASMKARAREVDSLSSRGFFWSAVLNAISDSLTKGIWLNNFQVAEGPAPEAVGAASEGAAPAAVRYLRIEGSAVGQGDETANIGRFITELKQNPVLAELFDDVRLSNINRRKIRDFDVYDFLLVCVFKKGKG